MSEAEKDARFLRLAGENMNAPPGRLDGAAAVRDSFLPLYKDLTAGVYFRLDREGRLLARCPACLAERTEPAERGGVEVVRAVNAFDALLAVARAYARVDRYEPYFGDVQDAMEALDAAHPGWRTWA